MKPYHLSCQLLLLLGLSLPVPASAQSLLWKITGNTLESPAWIYGTMHVQDERVFQLPEGWQEHMKATGRLILEVDLSQTPDPMKMMSLLQAPPDSSLDKLIAPADFAFLKEWFQDSLGMPLESLKQMKPFMLITLVQKSRMSSEMPLALDAWLSERAQNMNIPVSGLETIEEQMQVIDMMSLHDQAHMLIEMIRDDSKRIEQEDAMMDAYLQGHLDRLLTMASEWEIDPQFRQEIIHRRNRVMTDRLKEFLISGPVFIAVGALHLPGNDGIIQLLKNEGYSVEPVL